MSPSILVPTHPFRAGGESPGWDHFLGKPLPLANFAKTGGFLNDKIILNHRGV